MSSSAHHHHHHKHKHTHDSKARAEALNKTFQINLPFRNTVPVLPCGPYFRKLEFPPQSNSSTAVPEYRTSTLEKNYVWQPHLGPMVGVDLDLVDQESILQPKESQQHPLDPSEVKFLSGSFSSIKGKGKGKLKVIDQAAKPWWLRNTTYLENNVFHKPTLTNDDDVLAKSRENKGKQLDLTKDIFSAAYIEESFASVEDTTMNKLQEFNPGKKMEWCVPVLPVLYENSGLESRKRQHSLIRFDEDPAKITALPTGHDLNNGNDEHKSKYFKHLDALVMNIRPPAVADVVTRTNNCFEATLVAPMRADAAALSQPLEDEENEGDIRFEWMRDYQMELQDMNLTDSFMLVIDKKSLSARYFPISSRIDMKKSNRPMPHDCVVSRGKIELTSDAPEE